jgi:hypothetical protein
MELCLDGAEVFDRRGRPGVLRTQGGALVFRPHVRGVRDWIRLATGKSQYLISKLLNQLFNATAFSFPGTLFMALWTATLSASSTGSTAGEASYTGYARVSVTANTTNFPTSSGGAAITNGTAITFPANAGTLQTATFFAILDASSAGNILYWGSITSTAINPGDTPQVNTSALTVTES